MAEYPAERANPVGAEPAPGRRRRSVDVAEDNRLCHFVNVFKPGNDCLGKKIGIGQPVDFNPADLLFFAVGDAAVAKRREVFDRTEEHQFRLMKTGVVKRRIVVFGDIVADKKQPFRTDGKVEFFPAFAYQSLFHGFAPLVAAAGQFAETAAAVVAAFDQQFAVADDDGFD